MYIVNAKYFHSGARKRLVSEFEFIAFRDINVPSVLHFSTLVVQTLMSAELSNELCTAALLTGMGNSQSLLICLIYY